MSAEFNKILTDTKPIKVKEPLAEILGAFAGENAEIEYTFVDTVKMAGHVCPTVASAYVCCQEALGYLYGTQTPVRGEIKILVYGEPDEGSYGVMGQVLTFLTGAAPDTGFKGLGQKYRRKKLLEYTSDKIGTDCIAFSFKRTDTGKSVTVKLFPRFLPTDSEIAEKSPKLLEKILWEAASSGEKEQFKTLWLRKIKYITVDKKDINKWLILEEGGQ